MPLRLQRKRTKGFKLPAGCVIVTRPTRFCNPFSIDEFGELALKLFEDLAKGNWNPSFSDDDALVRRVYDLRIEWLKRLKDGSGMVAQDIIRSWLKGKDMACYCRLCEEHRDGKPLGVECSKCAPCHADILLRIANE